MGSDYLKPKFFINAEDCENGEPGIYLQINPDVTIKASENIEGFNRFIEHLDKIKKEIADNYKWFTES